MGGGSLRDGDNTIGWGKVLTRSNYKLIIEIIIILNITDSAKTQKWELLHVNEFLQNTYDAKNNKQGRNQVFESLRIVPTGQPNSL